MSASLQNEFISETYTSLLHLSGGGLNETPKRDLYDGAGNVTGLALSGTKVIANNVELPEQHVDSLEYTNNEITSLIDMFFPVGSIQITIDNTNPGTRIPGTVWESVAEGRFLCGVGGRNPSKGYIEYAPGDNEGGMGPNHDGLDSHVALTEDQLPRHTHVPESYDSQFSNVVTWTGTNDFTGPIDQEVLQGAGNGPPIYAFPATQPIAQTLSYVGTGTAFSISPISYGAYLWKRTQ
jgi:hypothetical protein